MKLFLSLLALSCSCSVYMCLSVCLYVVHKIKVLPLFGNIISLKKASNPSFLSDNNRQTTIQTIQIITTIIMMLIIKPPVLFQNTSHRYEISWSRDAKIIVKVDKWVCIMFYVSCFSKSLFIFQYKNFRLKVFDEMAFPIS